MLNDRERATLREVQRSLRPSTPIAPGDSSYSVQWSYTLPRWAYTTALVVAMTLGVLMLMARAPGSALVFAALAVMISVVQRHRDEASRRET
jgi:hypothetical protein